MATLQSILTQPIPDLSEGREVKIGYREHALLDEGPHGDEPMVAIELYGIAGQSYYSRPNNATSDPVPGVDPTIYLRKTIAEKLAAINYELQNSEVIEKLFGGKVELYVDEGYRSPELQTKLYHETFPYIIAQQHPDWSQKQVLSRRDELSASPPEKDRPSPHATGAAVDVKLRYQDERLGYVTGLEIEMGHGDGKTGHSANPDYYEHIDVRRPIDKKARKNRRIFYWVMKGGLNGDDSGFVVNPTEWWHWSYGDQMWAHLTQAPRAFYGQA